MVESWVQGWESCSTAEPQSSTSLTWVGDDLGGKWPHDCPSLLKERQWVGEASHLDGWPLGHQGRTEFLKGRMVTSVHFNMNIC